MSWKIEYTDEFGAWWDSLDEPTQALASAHIDLLEEHGPQLPCPLSRVPAHSSDATVRELRLEAPSGPARILYAVDRERRTLVLLGPLAGSGRETA